MRRFSLLMLGSVLTLAACDGSMTAPEITEAAAPALNAAMVGKTVMVPIRLQQSFQPASADFRDCGFGVFLPATVAADGQWSHLGRTSSLIDVDACEVTLEGLVFEGSADHTAANGDVLRATYTGSADESGNISIDATFIGGTGRFSSSAGSVTFTGVLDPATGSGFYRGTGWMTPPGA